ncbi:type VI secretion system tube protein Hcp [Leclercia sp. 29361]|uniref:Hcp family type VI secretion system effector n=1 Tax=unclassified Leclercia TaxID=2627398 RepID=UPI00140E3F10|nr:MULTISPECIES: type VI secretion system tube protein TssD [unclassified Leclercia]MDY0922107.1 type VI secretion system tube protein TssD [Leclercia sp. CFBP8987]QIK14502.1 type VI secretion system tube protein Hcp [Leclercia sp. 29361]
MSNPAYLWLTDENGSPIIGSCLIPGRLGAIEIKALTHNMNIPSCPNTGRLTGTRIHTPMIMQKEFDKTTPYLYRAISQNMTLKSATLKMYRVLDSGVETEYFNIILENIKVVSITPNLYPGNQTGTHTESIEIQYEKITWKHCDGNIVFTDAWNHRAIA